MKIANINTFSVFNTTMLLGSQRVLLVRAVQGGLKAAVLLLQLLRVHLQASGLLLLALHHAVQLLDVLPVLLLHLLLPIQNLQER